MKVRLRLVLSFWPNFRLAVPIAVVLMKKACETDLVAGIGHLFKQDIYFKSSF